MDGKTDPIAVTSAVPIDAQAGRAIKMGKLPFNLLLGAYYNVVKPTCGGDWQLRSQAALIL